MTYHLSIRQLMLSILLFIILLLLAAMAMIADNNIKQLTANDIGVAEDALQQLLQENFEQSRRILTRYGEERVAMTAENAATQLSLMLQGYDQTNYNFLRGSVPLRELANQKIYSSEGPVGYLDMYDTNGVSVLHPNKDIEGRNFSEWKDQYPDMWELVLRSFEENEVSGYYTFLDAENRKRQKFLVSYRVAGTPFIVSATVVIDKYFLPVHQALRLEGQEIADRSRQTIKESADKLSQKIKIRVGIWGLVLLVISFIAGFFLSAAISDPVRRLSRAARRVGRGNFAEQIPESGPNEIVDLAHSFNMMKGELVGYIDQVKEEAVSRQAMASEMQVAREIQTSLLPNRFPPFPDHREFALYAVNESAKEVAGDFYDFFFLTPATLALVIADVSGKGVPASLFMAVTRTLFRAICKHNKRDPGTALAQVNKALCENNDQCMFVTAVLVYYDIRTGDFSYANAGHDDPIVVKPDGDLRLLANPGNVVLGVDGSQQYTTSHDLLAPEEMLFCYTDGVTEAVGENNTFFGRKRLEQYLRDSAGQELDALCALLVGDLDRFQGENRFDDITILALKNQGDSPESQIL
ncbi:MAG: SpoIIE family protein phosphatase [Proteobacteria bacterium]|nr:SpoIIE family protein phosphatase [Pseudomonadota bacterium]MBU1138279.1 SpoIIE family protein phosphatase [Pseudomonadota bacterium]